MVITKAEAAEILKEIANKNRSWSNDFGLDYSKKVMKALQMGADVLQEGNVKIKTLVKGPKCPAHIEYVDNTLEGLQGLIRGYIESVTFEPGWCVLCDKDGIAKRRYRNCEIEGVQFVGKIAIVGVDGDEFTDFTASNEFRTKYPQLWEG